MGIALKRKGGEEAARGGEGEAGKSLSPCSRVVLKVPLLSSHRLCVVPVEVVVQDVPANTRIEVRPESAQPGQHGEGSFLWTNKVRVFSFLGVKNIFFFCFADFSFFAATQSVVRTASELGDVSFRLQACFSRRGVFDLANVSVTITTGSRKKVITPKEPCLVTVTK